MESKRPDLNLSSFFNTLFYHAGGGCHWEEARRLLEIAVHHTSTQVHNAVATDDAVRTNVQDLCDSWETQLQTVETEEDDSGNEGDDSGNEGDDSGDKGDDSGEDKEGHNLQEGLKGLQIR